MRVLLTFEPREGGVPENVMQLALGLPRNGWEVEVAGPADSPIYGRLRAAGVRVHAITGYRPGYGRPFADAAALFELAGVIGSRFDIVHTHSAKAGVLGRLAARMRGIPLVHSPHAFSFVGNFSFVRRGVAIGIERTLARLTATIICACRHERELARANGLRAPLRLVYYGTEMCGVGAAGADPVAVDEGVRSFAAGRKVVGSVAAMRPQKSLDVLISAAPAILAGDDECCIVMIGNGPLRSQLQEQARRLGLLNSGRFAFFQFDPPSVRYLPLLDVFVLPSSWEALPIGVLEAQACGIAQVVTDVDGTGEAVDEQTGILVPPQSPRALSQAVVELLADDERREEMSRRSRARHAERFSIERMIVETAGVYSEVLGRQPQSTRGPHTPPSG